MTQWQLSVIGKLLSQLQGIGNGGGGEGGMQSHLLFFFGGGGVHAVSLQDYPFFSSSVELEVNWVSKGSSLVVINKTALID